VVPLHPACAAILHGYLSRRSGTGPLLDNRHYPGAPLTPSAVSSLLARLITGLGIKGSAHSLRHSAATELLRASKGQAFEQTRAFLGHTDGATTRRYVATYDFDVAAAVAAMPDPSAAGVRGRPVPAWLANPLAVSTEAPPARVDPPVKAGEAARRAWP